MTMGGKKIFLRIAEAHPNSALADKLGGRTTKHAKAMSTLEKHGVRKGTYSKIQERTNVSNRLTRSVNVSQSLIFSKQYCTINE